jgi:hypothetical protein
MDELLTERYRRLFEEYDAEVGPTILTSHESAWPTLLWKRRADPERDLLQRVKARLDDAISRGKLRPDAGLCLLTLYDQMILRPYGGRLPRHLPIHPRARNFDSFSEAVDQSLSAIFERLPRTHIEPASSHEILLAIDASWDTLSEYFGWA